MSFARTTIHPKGKSISSNAFLPRSAFVICSKSFFLAALMLVLPLTASSETPLSGTPEKKQTDAPADSELCFVGQYPSKIVPEQIRIFAAPEKGNITHLIHPGKKVAKGTVFGRMNQKELALEKEEIETNLLKDRLTKQEEIIKQEREKKEIQFMMGISPNERKWLQENDYKKADKQILQTIDDKIKLARRELAITEKKKRAEFEKKEEAYTFTMPFDGRLQYQFLLPADLENNSQYTESGKEIAVAYDDSNFYLSISIANPEITKINPENLVLQFELSSGRKIFGTYSHRRVEKAQGFQGDMLAFFFRVPQQNHDEVYEMTGTNPLSKLYYKTEQNIRTLNKMDIASRPEAKDTTSWQELLNKIMPEYEVVLVGETQIIVRKK